MSARRLVLAAGAAYLVLQLVLFPPTRPPSWDEAVYLSQVTPGVPATAFAPSRARGIPILVAPVTLLGGSITAVRGFLVLASALALTGAALMWVPTLGRAAALLPLLVGCSWLGLFYGSEVMPNLWVGFGALAATGVLTRGLGETPTSRDSTLLGGLVALTALVRPPDALVLAVALALAVGLYGTRRHRTIVALGAGVALGWAAWLVEMSVRLRGPADAIRSALSVGHVTAGGLGDRLLQHLALTDGPTLGPEPTPRVPLGGTAWWVAIVTLGVIGLARRRSDPTIFRPLATASLAGIALLATYLVFVSGLAPRFLLPAYALFTVPAAAGLAALARGRSASAKASTAWLVAVTLLVGLAVWQLRTVARIGAAAVEARRAASDVGHAIRAEVGGGDCSIASASDWPQVAYASRCAGGPLRSDAPEQARALEDLAARGVRVFLVWRGPPPADLPQADPVPITTPAGWRVYELGGAPPRA